MLMQFIVALSGNITHLLIKIYKTNDRTDPDYNFNKIAKDFFKKDLALILASFILTVVFVLAINDPKYAGLPFVPSSLQEAVDFRTIIGCFVFGYFVDSILMILSRTEKEYFNKKKDKEEKEKDKE